MNQPIQAPRPVPFLVVSGVLAVVLAFALDLLDPNAMAGFGRSQQLVALVGVGLVGIAGLLATPLGAVPRRRIEAFVASEGVLSLVRFGGVALQLGVVVFLVRALRLENPALYERLLPFLFGAFVVHHLAPARFRLWLFVATCFGAIWLIFGSVAGAWLVGTGLGLIVLSHLPAPFSLRVVLVAIAGVGLAFMRSGTLSSPWPAGIWPILGSMFCFRLIIYLYDLRHQKEPMTGAHWARTLGYFFLPPNLVFPLFPVVDFATFRRTHYDRDALVIYQEGVHWMVRGMTHLLLYRLVYQYATLSPTEVVSLGSFVRYALANFGLYLRVSGQFHLIVGMLHLFGFRLPETHRFFFLASSYTDLWRRINIYWKDFMQRIFFMPLQLRLRGYGERLSLVMVTLVVVLATWFLHSYQWFWVLGQWLWSGTDAVFWGILGVILVASTLREQRVGRTRVLGKVTLTARQQVQLALTTIATFSSICFLWTLWAAPTFADFVSLFSFEQVSGRDVALLMLLLTGIGVAAVLSQRLALGAANRTTRPVVPRQVLASMFPLAVVWAAGQPGVLRLLDPRVGAVARDLRVAELNKRDAQQLQRGYYEKIIGVKATNGQLWEIYAKKPTSWPTLLQAGGQRLVSDMRRTELRPLLGLMFHGATLRTNRWGMRDRDLTELPPPNTFRLALLGQSYVMGSGVEDDETFENVIEDRLNKERAPSQRRIEILNFAAPEYSPLAQLTLLESDRVFRLAPNALLFTGHLTDFGVGPDLAEFVQQRRPIPFEFVRGRVLATGVDASMPKGEILKRLRPIEAEITAWAYQRIVQICRDRGITAWWTYLPVPLDRTTAEERATITKAAADAGFTLLDMGDVYGGSDERTIIVAEWDRHPNALGHRVIAERLYNVLMRDTTFTRLRTGALPLPGVRP